MKRRTKRTQRTNKRKRRGGEGRGGEEGGGGGESVENLVRGDSFKAKAKAKPKQSKIHKTRRQAGGFDTFFPTSLWVFCFLACMPSGCRGVVSRPPRLCHLISQLLISHNSSHTIHLTHNSSHTPHLTQFISHNSSHTQLISHNSSHTQLISHNSSHTQFISHNSSHTPLISHNSSHTTHLTHNSSHTQLISHTTHLTHLISQTSSHRPHLTDVLLGRRSTQSLLTEVRRGLAPQWPRLLVAWQAQYREPPEGAAARIGTAVAAATCCVAGAVQRASWRSCGADWRRRGRGCV